LLFEEAGASVQLLSSRNADWPFSVIGVSVIVHVWVIGPDELWIVLTVTTVTGVLDCRLSKIREVFAGAAKTRFGIQKREKVKQTR